MDVVPTRELIVGHNENRRSIIMRQRPGNAPGLFWLGGFRSDMAGSKAMAIDAFGAAHGLMVTRFDYSGHGLSGGDFSLGTISLWLEEAHAAFATTHGPQIVIGSSMGGWLALLLARDLLSRGTPLRGLVLIAPAADMTHELMLKNFSAREHEQLAARGYIEQPSEYSAEPYRITRALIEDGANHLLLGKVVEPGCPVIILQGGQDHAVPQSHTIRLTTHLLHDPVTLTLIPDGDHRLSRPQDLQMLTEAVGRLIESHQ